MHLLSIVMKLLYVAFAMIQYLLIDANKYVGMFPNNQKASMIGVTGCYFQMIGIILGIFDLPFMFHCVFIGSSMQILAFHMYN